jgi:transposase
MSVPRFLRSAFPGYEISDVKEYLASGRIELHLERGKEKPFTCHRCGGELAAERGKYRCRIEAMPVMGLRLFVHFWRHRGECRSCRKARAEHVSFLAEETPHLTQEYAWWLGRLCEIAAVSRVAELMQQDETTTWRLDLARMKRMLAHYRIPAVRQISVDEVYARKKPKFKGESRDERFFTVICDLETRRVIWVSESRKKEALDQFFMLVGPEACQRIEVVATDQHEGYARSIAQYCPNATHVWDRFHLMQLFEEAVNETRKQLHEVQEPGSEIRRLTRGGYRFLFVKKAIRRTEEEKLHIDDVLRENEKFAKLELIKERMLSFFDQPEESEAKRIFEEIGDWIWQAGFSPLMSWYRQFESGWKTVKNFFRYRVTSALSEGHNNVIKMLKRRAFGYKNMEYFRLKIMQVCGYLNSRYVRTPDQLLANF